MKKIITPGFEFIFSVALVAIIGLPPLVLGQTQKSTEIRIVNGDTTINGKDIKKLSAQERKDALAEINNLPTPPLYNNNSVITNRTITIERETTGDGKNNHITIERNMDNDNEIVAGSGNDSARNDVRLRLKKLRGNDSSQAFTYRFDKDLPPMRIEPFNFDFPRRRPGFEFNGRNTQSFSYDNTDADGISTHISYRVTEAPKEKLKAMGLIKPLLTVTDINITYEFSTGKTVLAFNLPAKTGAAIKLTDSRGDIIWADKSSTGSFSKKFNLPLNGVYYLQVQQGANVAVKRIVKE
ncbi:T9SS type A sorting domain-containing protein [Mucilaginibacter sp. AK015]|uniref:T9SS type A sorting domain-containing protein n=1 Tax=Mucilaginibacter sp. AK015 TaxID=2723072 RepID=UPI00161F1FE0|nr:T9SS type A sorting domain-containing protein [Mucilaginibacter sp. AK015]MBB5396408.1 hypothetical protein [Mucilaginibacter sp. AK015]